MPPRAVVVVARSARLWLWLWIWIWIWQMMWLIDKFFGQNLFNLFLLNQINHVNIISYKFAGNGNIPKSCYSFRKVVTFKKVVIFLTDTIFRKIVIFSKRHNFLDKMGLNRFHWTDMFLAENGYKRKSIFDFLITEKFLFVCIYFFSLKIKSKCRLTEFVWLVAILQFVEVKENWGTAISLTGLIHFILKEINP